MYDEMQCSEFEDPDKNLESNKLNCAIKECKAAGDAITLM